MTAAEFLEPVQADLAAMEDFLAPELRPQERFLGEYLAHVSRYRGKRLRPALVFLVARSLGRVTPDHVRLAAVAELLHTATLVHDDILDAAAIRRGNPTAHTVFGTEQTVLLGDYLFARAYELACRGSEPEIAVFLARTAQAICVGEMLQIRNRGNLEIGEPDYFRIIEQKTAALYAACGFIGAHYGGGGPRESGAFSEFGRNVGIAFQIADDLLDLTGDERVLGKTLGTDVGNGKLTLPLIRMLEVLPAGERARVRQGLLRNGHDGHAGHDGPPGWRALLGSTGALDYAHSRAGDFVAAAKRAVGSLGAIPLRENLEAFADFVISRNA
ncbi:MAG: polyprenyl synthetase family protein [Planctomycetales bacterium]|nr:polyprenyl synthetase family protein [Planctomycetales bacterium]